MSNWTHEHYWFFKLTSFSWWSHELFCKECRVTWYSYILRVLDIGGMSPKAKNWRRR